MSVRRLRHRAPTRPSLTAALFFFVSLLALSAGAFAGSLSLAWDPVAGATGYTLSYGTASGSYSASLDAGSKTSATVSGLTEGTRYYFAVQAYNATTTSAYSNEVNAVVPTTATVPVASFTANGSTASSITVTQGQTVNLVDTSTGTVASRSWNLGDGTTATTATVVKSYSTTGTKTVALSVTGAGVTKSASKTINVTAAAPVANFSATPLSGTAPLTVQFTDASTGSISSRSWNFGNGFTSTATSPSTIYNQAGTYTVALTVTGSGGSNTATQTITVQSATTGGDATVSTAGLVAAYGFEETSGNDILDSSGNNNKGTLSGASRVSGGKFGKALSFNGSNSLVTVPDSASLDLTTGMTLSAWVYPTAYASSWKSVLIKETNGGLVYSLYANSDINTPSTSITISGAERILSAGSRLNANSGWAHLAATYDGAMQRLYVNGSQVGSRAQTGGMAVSGGALRIGGIPTWSSEYFAGLIDEVRIYNRALSQSEIAAVMQQPVGATSAAAAPATRVCTTPCSLWDNATTPSVAASSSTSAMELGVKFRSDVAGQVTGVRFYKGSGNTGTHVGRLWSTSGKLLAQATFVNESPTGWQQVNFASPVAIQANTTYVVSYYAPAGRYAYDREYFASAFVKPPLRALSSTEASGNGVYRYGSGGGFPTSSYRSANYWVDIVFKTP